MNYIKDIPNDLKARKNAEMTANLKPLATGIICSILLTACVTTQNGPLGKPSNLHRNPTPSAYVPTMPPPVTTQSVALPGDKSLAKAQQHFHREEYGLAEKHFRLANHENPKNLDALLGLAASYDHLKRFDLANNTYRQAAKISHRSTDVLNNWGYSYLLRGNVVAARKKFLKAYEIDPKNKAVNANLELLREGIRRNSRKRT